MKVIDLFSGLGGFSQAFVDRGHTVERYDNDPQFKEVPHTLLMDIWDLKPTDMTDADIVLMSPPCNCFSPMTIGHYWKGGVPDKRAKEMIKLVKHSIGLAKQSGAKYWLLENPAGMLKHAIGEPQKLTWWAAWGHFTLKPTHLWGELPPIDWRPRPAKGTYEAAPRGTKLGVQRSDLTSAERALVPYDFSMAVFLAAEGLSSQRTLEEFVQ